MKPLGVHYKPTLLKTSKGRWKAWNWSTSNKKSVFSHYKKRTTSWRLGCSKWSSSTNRIWLCTRTTTTMNPSATLKSCQSTHRIITVAIAETPITKSLTIKAITSLLPIWSRTITPRVEMTVMPAAVPIGTRGPLCSDSLIYSLPQTTTTSNYSILLWTTWGLFKLTTSY